MRVHHLNCISTCPAGGALVDGKSGLSWRGRLACHCLLLEMRSALVLVDTGFGLNDVKNPWGRLSKLFLALVRPELREEMTAIRQIERLGFDPKDVRHIVLTHLDCDRAGGLDDFPGATVHLMADEQAAAFARRTRLDKMRYRPQQWSTAANWEIYDADDGDTWMGFDAVRELDGLTGEVALVPLKGHTLGHAGVAVRRDDRWLLQTGDAYVYAAEMSPTSPWCTPGLSLYQRMMEQDRPARLANQDRLRALKRDHGDDVTVFCSHDVSEFEALAGHRFDVPVNTPRFAEPARQRPMLVPGLTRSTSSSF